MSAYNITLEEDVDADEDDELWTGDQYGDIIKDYGSTRNDIYLQESGQMNSSSVRGGAKPRGHSFNHLIHTSLSISTLAKPSDDRKNNAILAGWNVSNMIQGTGILGIPYAVQQGGWTAVVMIFLVALICCHTGKLIINCMYETSKKTSVKRRLRVNYPEIAEAVFGHKGLIIVGVFQNIELFSAAVMYIILLGTGWSDLFKAYPQLGLKEWAAINCLIVLPALFIRRMSVISWLSMISVFALIGALLVLIVYTLTEIPMWKISNIPPFNPQTFPIGFGIIVFSYCAHPVFPSVEGSMAEPDKFNSMLNCSFLLAAIVKTCLGAFMVLRFGDDTAQVATVNVADNVIFSRLSTILVVSNVLLAIPLVMFVVNISFEDAFMPYFPHLNRDSKYYWVWLLITRPLLIAIALFVAIMVPFFGLIMGVVGSLTGTCLCFLFPCYFHLKIRWKMLKIWEIVVDIAIMIFGVVAGVSGLILSMKALIHGLANA